MARTKGPRGGGFLGGVVAGLSLSALGLGMLAVSAPSPPQPGDRAANVAIDPTQKAPIVLAQDTSQGAAAAPDADLTPLNGPASPIQGAHGAGAARGTEAGQDVADGSGPAGEPGAAPAPEPPPVDVDAPSPTDAREAGAAPEAQPVVAREPDAAPAPPPLVRNAAAFTASGNPLVSVILTGLEPASEHLSRVFDLDAPLTLALDPAAAGGEALGVRAREAGFEVVSRGALADSHAVGSYAVGLARARWDADARTLAHDDGMLALALNPSSDDMSTTGSRGAADADITVGFSLDEAASAERVFQTLQEATRRAGENGGVAVALAASDAALTGLARWLAVTEADAAPISALMP